ncbi:cytochrome P450 [Xylariomycetidae sp. FL2044]|nr:cytochrome P450 [Xylariomycetidae sp. FL2044]
MSGLSGRDREHDGCKWYDAAVGCLTFTCATHFEFQHPQLGKSQPSLPELRDNGYTGSPRPQTELFTMELLNSTGEPTPWTLMEQSPFPAEYLLGFSLMLILAYALWRPSSKQPPSLAETIPFVSNTYMFMTSREAFLKKVSEALKSANVVKFRIAGKKMYIVAGQQNVQALMKNTPGLRSETAVASLLESVWAMPSKEAEVWRNDKSGRGKVPLPGTEDTPAHMRYWATSHHFYDQYLTTKKYTDDYGLKYHEMFSSHLDRMPRDEWQTFCLSEWLRSDMAECAITSVMGPRIIEMNDGFMPALWATDRATPDLVSGPPRWLKPGPYQIRDHFYAMASKWVTSSLASFDWDGPEKDVEWEELFGARVTREQARWMSENHCTETLGGFFGTFAAGVVANSVPTITWAIMELLKNPQLYQEVREEVLSMVRVDDKTGARTLDVPQLQRLPLLQAVYAETMRVHVSYTVTRDITAPIVIDGYELEKGASVSATTILAHADEAVWNPDGKTPSSEFNVHRHIKIVDKVDENGNRVRERAYAMAARPSSYFPYGGGNSICPGRHVAKQHILSTLGLLLARFEIEFVEWVGPDGLKSDREPGHISAYVGILAMPPDRDARVRWRKVW